MLALALSLYYYAIKNRIVANLKSLNPQKCQLPDRVQNIQIMVNHLND